MRWLVDWCASTVDGAYFTNMRFSIDEKEPVWGPRVFDLTGATVLITGGTGFLGRRVADELALAGAQVHALGSKDGDLRSGSETRRLLARIRPDAVIHLAAVVGGIGANRANPGRFFYDNAVMGIELIEACRLAEVRKTVIAGTVCAYPKFAEVPFQEDDIWNGYPEETNAPYGIAKRALLVQAQAYRDQYGMNIIYLLPVNLYGPGDNFDLDSSHVVAAMIRKFIEAEDAGGDTVTLWGDGNPTREFVHVRDTARAFRLALECYDHPQPVNIGSGDEISIRALAELVARLVGYRGKILWDPSQPNGQLRRKLATDRAKAAFGFEAQITLEDGVRETIAWYRARSAGD